MELSWTGDKSAGCFNGREGWMAVQITPEQRQRIIEQCRGQQLYLTIGDMRIPIVIDESLPENVIRFRRSPWRGE